MRQVVRLDHIILLFVETVGDDDLIRVLLRVDRVLLETDIHLTEGLIGVGLAPIAFQNAR